MVEGREPRRSNLVILFDSHWVSFVVVVVFFFPVMGGSVDDGSMVVGSVERQKQDQGSDEQEGLESWECWEDIEEADDVVSSHIDELYIQGFLLRGELF